MATDCSKHDPPCFKNNFYLRAGLILVAEGGLMSFIFPLSLLIYSLRQLYIKYHGRKRASTSNVKPGVQPISVLFLCSIFADMLCGLGHSMSIRWVLAGEVIEGPYCTGQAALLQIGNNGVSWFTTAIAVLTYLQVAHSNPLSKRGAKIFAAGSICFTTVFTLLVIAIPASMVSPYYGNAGLWCWLPGTNPSRQRLRFASQYVWNWLAILVSIATYGTVAYKWLFRGPFRTNCDIKRAAIAMGWYPITYLIVTAPSSSIRFRQFHGYQPNTAERIFPFVLAVSHGAINVILWFMTGRRFGFSPNKKNVSPDSEILSFKDVETSTSQATPTDGDGVRHSAVTIPIPPPTWTPERPNGSVPSVTQVSSPPGLSGNDIHMYPCSLSPIPGSPNSDQTIVISNID